MRLHLTIRTQVMIGKDSAIMYYILHNYQGEFQSPIDIPTSVASNHSNVRNLRFSTNLDYDIDLNIKNERIEDHGYSFAINLDKDQGGLAFFDEKNRIYLYDVQQIHFHSPSEHAFNGKHYDLEMHIVHKQIES